MNMPRSQQILYGPIQQWQAAFCTGEHHLFIEDVREPFFLGTFFPYFAMHTS